MCHSNEASISLTAVHTFRIYCSGSDGPVLFLLHGGGHSALSWAVFTVSVRSITEHPHTLNSPLPSVKNTWILLYTFLSVTAYFNLRRPLKCVPCGFGLQGVICSRINCRVVAMDLRAHGKHFPPLWQLILKWIRLSCQSLHVKSWGYDLTPQLYHAWHQRVKCASFLFGRRLQSEKPRWSLSRHDGQVSCCMHCLQLCILHKPILVVF